MGFLRDQRMMTGPAPLESPEQVRAFWEDFAQRQRRAGRSNFKLQRSRLKLHAYVSDGRWVADCRECGGGIALWRENDEACCLDCGYVFSKIGWPDEEQVAKAELVLAARPGNEHQHWYPHEGETVDDLKVDNLREGFPPAVRPE